MSIQQTLESILRAGAEIGQRKARPAGRTAGGGTVLQDPGTSMSARDLTAALANVRGDAGRTLSGAAPPPPHTPGLAALLPGSPSRDATASPTPPRGQGSPGRGLAVASDPTPLLQQANVTLERIARAIEGGSLSSGNPRWMTRDDVRGMVDPTAAQQIIDWSHRQRGQDPLPRPELMGRLKSHDLATAAGQPTARGWQQLIPGPPGLQNPGSTNSQRTIAPPPAPRRTARPTGQATSLTRGQRVIMAAGKAADPLLSFATQHSATLQGIAQAAQLGAKVGGPVGAGIAALGYATIKATIALYKFPFSVEKAALAMLQSQEHLRRFNGQLAMTFARAERAKLEMDYKTAARVAPQTAALGADWARLMKEVQPIRDDVRVISTFSMRVVVRMAEQVLYAIRLFSVVFPAIKAAADKLAQDQRVNANTPARQWMDSILAMKPPDPFRNQGPGNRRRR